MASPVSSSRADSNMESRSPSTDGLLRRWLMTDRQLPETARAAWNRRYFEVGSLSVKPSDQKLSPIC
jgi:hypothetical protein